MRELRERESRYIYVHVHATSAAASLSWRVFSRGSGLETTGDSNNGPAGFCGAREGRASVSIRL